MLVVVKNDIVVATHTDDQDVAALYPGSTVLAVPDGTPVEVGQPWALTLEDQKAAACARIEAERDRRLSAGVAVNWPGADQGTPAVTSLVQTRGERDITNIMGVAARGLKLLTQGQATTLIFRDADNVNHELLPVQAIDLGEQVAVAIQAIYDASWRAKDAVMAVTDMEGVAGVAAAEAGVVWP